jgi:hypothetical protein
MAEFASRQRLPSITRVTVKDLPAVYDLYRAIEPLHDITAEGFARWWRWLYVDNPRSLSVVLGSFDVGSRNIGHLALLPIDFLIDGEHVLACSACQLMIAEEQRRTLLYPTLVREFFKAYAEHGCDFCYSQVTRARVLAANLALGFRKGARLPVYARPYRFGKLARLSLGHTSEFLRPAVWVAEKLMHLSGPYSGRPFTVTQERGFPVHFESFLQGVRSQFKLAALRTVQILNWRFVGNADRGYRIFLASEGQRPAGYAVVRRMPMREFDTLAIVDILFDIDRPGIGHALLRTIHQLALSEGVDIAVTMLSEHSPFLRVLRGWGFIESPEQFTLVLHEPKNGPHQLAARPAVDWHVTWFDHDFV